MDPVLRDKMLKAVRRVAERARMNATWSRKIPPQIRYRVSGSQGIVDVPTPGGFAWAAEYGARHPSGWTVHRHPDDRASWAWGVFSDANPKGRPFLRPAVAEEADFFAEAMGEVLDEWARRNGFR